MGRRDRVPRRPRNGSGPGHPKSNSVWEEEAKRTSREKKKKKEGGKKKQKKKDDSTLPPFIAREGVRVLGCDSEHDSVTSDVRLHQGHHITFGGRFQQPLQFSVVEVGIHAWIRFFSPTKGTSLFNNIVASHAHLIACSMHESGHAEPTCNTICTYLPFIFQMVA